MPHESAALHVRYRTCRSRFQENERFPASTVISQKATEDLLQAQLTPSNRWDPDSANRIPAPLHHLACRCSKVVQLPAFDRRVEQTIPP
jgi:hypothetical protein